MLAFKYVSVAGGIGIFLVGLAIAVYDLWSVPAAGGGALPPAPVRWRTGIALALVAWAPLLIALSIVLG
jgi:hypothetical protein